MKVLLRSEVLWGCVGDDLDLTDAPVECSANDGDLRGDSRSCNVGDSALELRDLRDSDFASLPDSLSRSIARDVGLPEL